MSTGRRFATLLAVAALWIFSVDAYAAKRLAFVVGNSQYPAWPLVNPANDARAISQKLSSLGFEVTTQLELRRDDIGVVTETFLRKVSPGDTVVFFYAGHGVQVAGQNYLLAIDAKIRSQYDVPLNGIDVGRFMSRLDNTRAAVKLVFLDACRNNPFEGAFRGGAGRGLARIGAAPFGTLISFATQPGGVAADGEGSHGLYTEQLLTHIGTPGLPVEQMLKRVAVSTHRVSEGAQRPWIEGGLFGDFVFREESADAPSESAGSGSLAVEDFANAAWGFASQIDSPAAYRAYLREYPNGAHAGLARIKLAIVATEQASLQESPVQQAAIEKPSHVPIAFPKATIPKQNFEQAVPKASADGPQVALVTKESAATKPATKIEPERWDLARLNGKTITSQADAPFAVQLEVSGNRLMVREFVWRSVAPDADGYSRRSLRCGIFSSSLSVSSDGQVSGSCSANGLSVSVSGQLQQLVLDGTYLARGGQARLPATAVPMKRP